MGEALDYSIGQPIKMYVVTHGGALLVFRGEVTWTWDEFVDVRVGEQILRVPRADVREDSGAAGAFFMDGQVEMIDFAHYDPAEEAVSG